MNRSATILLALILIGGAHAGWGQTPYIVTINLAAKTVSTSNRIAIRETVPTQLVNIGVHAPSNLVLRMVDGTQTMAYAAAWTNAGTNAASGNLDLNTAELTNHFAEVGAQGIRVLTLALWDVGLNRLLVNARVQVQNNPYAPGMPGPNPVGVSYLPGTRIGDTNWVAGGFYQAGVTQGTFQLLLPDELVAVLTNVPWSSISGDITAQAQLMAEFAVRDAIITTATNLAAIAHGWGNHATNGYLTSVTGLGTDTLARADASNALAWAQAGSNLAASAAAWGDHATNGYVTSVSGLGTDLIARADASNALAWAQAGSNLAAAASALAGNASATLSNTSFAVNGQNITGRWYALGNAATGAYAFVGGGLGNFAVGEQSMVGGGGDNYAVGDYAFVGGGYNNSAAGGHAVVGGGEDNSAVGIAATIPGGLGNIASSYAFAAGTLALATNSGSFVWSGPGSTNVSFGSRGDNTFNVRSVGGVYFLAPALYIQDTNGNTVAAFTATNSTISGDLNLTGYATTQQWHTLNIGKLDTTTAASTYFRRTNEWSLNLGETGFPDRNGTLYLRSATLGEWRDLKADDGGFGNKTFSTAGGDDLLLTRRKGTNLWFDGDLVVGGSGPWGVGGGAGRIFLKDASSGITASITATGGLQVGTASFYAYPSGDLYQDATNWSHFGSVTASSYRVHGGASPWAAEAAQITTLTGEVASLRTWTNLMWSAYTSLVAQFTSATTAQHLAHTTLQSNFISATSALWVAQNASSSNLTSATNTLWAGTTGLTHSLALSIGVVSNGLTNINAVAIGGTPLGGLVSYAGYQADITNFARVVSAPLSNGAAGAFGFLAWANVGSTNVLRGYVSTNWTEIPGRTF